MNRDIYQEPLVSRYTSPEMQWLFSERNKFQTWRRCWVALAEAERELGLTDIITERMIDELKAHQDDINFDVAQAKEKEIRHDVMAHVYAYGQQCPTAEPIIHLGATSQFVGCNADLIMQRDALKLVKKALVNVIANLAAFSRKYKDMANSGLHPLSAGPADHGGKKKYPVYSRSYYGS